MAFYDAIDSTEMGRSVDNVNFAGLDGLTWVRLIVRLHRALSYENVCQTPSTSTDTSERDKIVKTEQIKQLKKKDNK